MNKTNTSSNTSWLRRMVSCLCMLGMMLAVSANVSANPSQSEAEQQRKVSGRVLDEAGQPLVGVTIISTVTTQGVITDAEGTFELRVGANDKLMVSFLGMEDQTVEVGDKNYLEVTMVSQASALEEVTVVAFGTQKKESVVASITAVSPKDLKVPSGNLTSALAGRMAGLISYQQSGEPGADNAKFFVRGVTSFGYSQDPLILLDGFEITSEDLAAIDSDNIEQFVILKDATAAALYGSKGANGVISVTTKKGREGPARVAFRHESRFSTPTQLPEAVDGVTYMNLYNEAYENDFPGEPSRYTAQKILNTKKGVNEYAYPNVNWYDEMFDKFAYNQHYSLNVSGGGKVVSYYVSGGYLNERGVLKNNRLNNFKNNVSVNRFNVTAKVNVNITKTTKLEINMQSVFKNYGGPNNSTGTGEGSDSNASDATVVFNNVWRGNPIEFPKYYSTDYLFGDNADDLRSLPGRVLFGKDEANSMTNPYAEMVKGYKDGFQNTIISMMTLNQDLKFVTPGLAAHAKVNIKNYAAYESRRSYSPWYYSLAEYDEFENKYRLAQAGGDGNTTLGDASTTRETTSKLYFEAGITYSRTFKDAHEVNAVLLYTQEENKKSGTSDIRTIQSALPSRNQGIRLRATYAYKGRYMFEGSLTYNGSEKFAKKYRWGLFPSIGVGYMISNEKFWEPISRYVNKLKFRYSWGKVGNDNIAGEADRFMFLSSITSGGSGYTANSTGTAYYGSYNIVRMANETITWEIATKQNIGIDLSLFNAVDIMVEYFTEERTGIYQRRESIPSSTGLSGNDLYGNVGAAKSHGVDASLDLNYSFNKDAFISGRFNFTYAKSEVTEKDEPAYKESLKHLSRVGYPSAQSWGYIAERLFIDADDVANSPKQEVASGAVVQPGDIKYKDINGDGIVNSNDQVALGFPSYSPEINYGFGLSGGYKSFDLSFFFQGQGRGSFFIDPNGILPFSGYRNCLQFIADSHWSPNNPVSQAFWPRLSTGSATNNMVSNSTWWLRNSSFIRLKSVEFGYSISPKILKKTPIKQFRVYLQGSNLFVASGYKLWDPEMGSNGLGYPLQRVYSIGLQIQF
ncbi:MAG: TonB-dependent receptor [Rikenellaceae bacterium]|nr:TonB-dependent receptor [Rikenellaceae bacterium]